MTAPENPPGTQARPKTSVWQTLLVLPALGSLGLGVVLPLWLMVASTSTVFSLAVCAKRLEQLGVRSYELLLMAGIVSAVLVLGGLGAATWASIEQQSRQHLQTKKRGGPLAWLLRHPWWTLGLALFVADMGLMREPSRHGLVAASILLSECSWLTLTFVWLTWRLAWASLKLGWRMSRASAFMAGLVVAAGLFTVVGWSAFFSVAEEFGRQATSSLQNAAPRWPQASGSGSSLGQGSSFGTSADLPAIPALFERPQHGARLLTPVHLGDPGEELFGVQGSEDGEADDFSTCVLGLSDRLRSEATQQASRYVDRFEAQDVVQDVLLRVCERGRSPAEHPDYFIRSVQNRASSWRRRAARACALIELPEPGCGLHPEAQYLREEESRAVNKALCALSEAEQEVLRLRFFEHQDYATMARDLGWTEVNVRQRVSRASKKFRAAYREKCLQ